MYRHSPHRMQEKCGFMVPPSFFPSLSLSLLPLSPFSLSLPSPSLSLILPFSPFQGLIRDAKRRYRYYLSDFRDAIWDTSLNRCSFLTLLSTLAAIIFIYFVNIAPAITFGQVLSETTDGQLVRRHFGGHCWAFWRAWSGILESIVRHFRGHCPALWWALNRSIR